MQDAFRILFGEQGVTFRRNAFSFTTFNFAGITISAVQIAIVITAALVFAGLHLFTTRTRIGVGWRATVSKPQIAASFGIDPIKVRYLNFAIGSALAAVAGGLVALLNNLVDPTIGFVVSYKALAIIVLGGLGSVRGTLVASLVLGLVEVLRHHLHRRLARPRRHRVPCPDPAADDPAAGFYRSAHGMSAYEISIISIVGINVILAVSLNMISGFCGQVSLGHGAFFGAGAYAAALAMVATASVPLALARGGR